MGASGSTSPSNPAIGSLNRAVPVAASSCHVTISRLGSEGTSAGSTTLGATCVLVQPVSRFGPTWSR